MRSKTMSYQITIEELIEQIIDNKIAQLQRQIDQLRPKQYMTRKEAAKYYRVSLTTIDKAVKNNRMESEMIEGNRRIIIRNKIQGE